MCEILKLCNTVFVIFELKTSSEYIKHTEQNRKGNNF